MLVALSAWLVTASQMGEMHDHPMGLVAYLVSWVPMSTAMMLPSTLPATALVARLGAGRLRTSAFVSGYLSIWVALGVVAFGIAWPLEAVDDRALAGAAIGLAALYQLTRLKGRCLERCRSPLAIFRGWRDGPLGSARMGAVHGIDCAGCCAGLMLALIAIGASSLVWMAVFAAAIVTEKALLGARATVPLAGALFALAVLTIV